MLRSADGPGRGIADPRLNSGAGAGAGTGVDSGVDPGTGEAVRRVLGGLSEEGWRIFHDVGWPGRSQLGIDHVLVGPGGVFVVETLTWSGAVGVHAGMLRQDGKRRHRHVVAAAAAAMAIGELLPGLDSKVIHPVICFDREDTVFGWCGDVLVCSRHQVVSFLTSRPRGLSEAQMTDVAEVLAISLEVAHSQGPAVLAPYSAHPSAHPSAQPSAQPSVQPSSVRSSETRVPRGQRLPRAPLPRPVRLLLTFAVLVGVAVLGFSFDVPKRLGELVSSAMERVVTPTQVIGSTVSVPGAGDRPPLEMTAGEPVVSHSTRSAVRPSEGQQLLAVRVVVRNVGEHAWRSDSNLTAVLTDTTGASFSNDPAYRSVAPSSVAPSSTEPSSTEPNSTDQRRALRSTIRLQPGQQIEGVIVFEVPEGTRTAAVQLRLGPGLPTTVRWTVG